LGLAGRDGTGRSAAESQGVGSRRAFTRCDTIIDQIERFQLSHICGRIQPLGCLMAGDPGPAPWKKRKKEPSPKQLRQQAHRSERRSNRQELNEDFSE